MKKIIKSLEMVYAGFVTLGDYGATSLEEVFSVSAPTDFAGFVNAAFRIALIVGAALATLRIVQGGIMYAISDVAVKLDDAKKILKNASLGLLFLLMIYVILYQINPQLLELKLAPTSVGDTNTSVGVTGTNNVIGTFSTAPTGSWCYSDECYSSEAACESVKSFYNFWGTCLQKTQ